MNILILEDSMQIIAKNHKILTRIIRLIDSTPLRWRVTSDFSVLVDGGKELMYELLSKIADTYFGKIEII